MKPVIFEDQEKHERSHYAMTKSEIEAVVKRIAGRAFGEKICNRRLEKQEYHEQPVMMGVDTEGFSISIERGWAVGVTVSLRNRHDYKMRKSVGGENFVVTNWRADINWSGTGRDIAQAQASIRLYQQAVDFASEFIAWADGRFDYIDMEDIGE